MTPLIKSLTGARILLLVVITIWGLNFPVMKGVINQIDPYAFNAVRLSIAVIALLTYTILVEGLPRLTGRELLKLIGLGVIGSTLYHALMILGLSHGSPENTALFVATSPIWTTIFVTLFGWEKIKSFGWIGVLLSFAGAALVIISSEQSATSPGENVLLGAALTLGAAICWGLYTVLSKNLLQRHSPLQMTSISLAFGVLFLWPISITQVAQTPWASFDVTIWLGIFYTGLFSIGLAYALWAYGVREIGASQTAVYVNLVPVITFIAAFVILSRPFFPLQILGGLVVIAGIYITNRARIQPAPSVR